MTERPLRVVTLGAAYSTDLGGSLSASWAHRNLFGNAEVLTLSAAATELGGTAARQPGYNASATLDIPDWLQRGQTLSFNVLAVREYLQAYDRTAVIPSVHAVAQALRRAHRAWRAAVRAGAILPGRRDPRLLAVPGAARRELRQHGLAVQSGARHPRCASPSRRATAWRAAAPATPSS